MNDLTVARGLGLFSLGLGAAEIFAPKWVEKQTGVKGEKLIRGYGMREIGAGLAILGRANKSHGLWSRVVGDFIDLRTLRQGFAKKRYRKKAAFAIAMVAGITLIDFIYARRLAY